MAASLEDPDFRLAAGTGLTTPGRSRSEAKPIPSGGPVDPNSARSITGSNGDVAVSGAKSEDDFALGATGTGRKVMQSPSDKRYIANVVDGKVQFYWTPGSHAG